MEKKVWKLSKVLYFYSFFSDALFPSQYIHNTERTVTMTGLTFPAARLHTPPKSVIIAIDGTWIFLEPVFTPFFPQVLHLRAITLSNLGFTLTWRFPSASGSKAKFRLWRTRSLQNSDCSVSCWCFYFGLLCVNSVSCFVSVFTLFPFPGLVVAQLEPTPLAAIHHARPLASLLPKRSFKASS